MTKIRVAFVLAMAVHTYLANIRIAARTLTAKLALAAGGYAVAVAVTLKAGIRVGFASVLTFFLNAFLAIARVAFHAPRPAARIKNTFRTRLSTYRVTVARNTVAVALTFFTFFNTSAFVVTLQTIRLISALVLAGAVDTFLALRAVAVRFTRASFTVCTSLARRVAAPRPAFAVHALFTRAARRVTRPAPAPVRNFGRTE
jgi:hypothetical protein